MLRPRPGPAPQRDPTCSTCSEPLATQHAIDPNKKQYAIGDIVAIQESVHTPIDPLFASVAAVQPAASSLDNVSRVSKGLDGEGSPVRPAVILEPRLIAQQDQEEDTSYLMLMATYKGTHTLAELPLVLQHFCVAVSPHCEIGEDVTHLHTSPEWQKDHAWLIARPFFSSGTVSKRWGWKDGQGKAQAGSAFKVDKPDVTRLLRTHQTKWEEWLEQCEQKGYLEDRYKEYEVRK